MLKSTLSSQLGSELDDETNSDVITLIEDYIDEVIQSIANKFKMPLLNITYEKTLLTGTNNLSVANVVDIIRIQRKDNYLPIPLVTEDWLVSNAENLDITGPPYWAYILSFTPSTQSYTVGFDRIADTDYTLLIVCKKTIGPIASDSHIPFPDNLLGTVKNGVRSLFYLHEENQVYQAYESKFNRGIDDYLELYAQMSGQNTISKPNSDLMFASGVSAYDPNMDLSSRFIPYE